MYYSNTAASLLDQKKEVCENLCKTPTEVRVSPSTLLPTVLLLDDMQTEINLNLLFQYKQLSTGQ